MITFKIYYTLAFLATLTMHIWMIRRVLYYNITSSLPHMSNRINKSSENGVSSKSTDEVPCQQKPMAHIEFSFRNYYLRSYMELSVPY